jgi:hypothetical protein
MVKRALVGLGAGLAVGLGWGWWSHALWPGWVVGAFLGSGLAMLLGLPRGEPGFLRLPPWHAVVGALLVGLSGGAMVSPGVVFDPTWVLGGTVEVGRGPGFVLWTDVPRPEEDRALAHALTAFRAEVARYVLDPGPPSCSVRITVVRDPARYNHARRFGMPSDFGYYAARTLAGPTVVHPEGAGLGSLTHHLGYHLLQCGAQRPLPRWVRTMTATFFEKLFMAETDAGWVATVGYRHTWRDAALRSDPTSMDLHGALTRGTDQDTLHAWGLFLHHHGQLRPLLAAFARGDESGAQAVLATLAPDREALAQRFQRWFLTDALQIPSVEGSFMAPGESGHRLWRRLAQTRRWDDSRRVWLDPPGASRPPISPAGP